MAPLCPLLQLSEQENPSRNDKLERESLTKREKLNKREMIGGNNARGGPRYAVKTKNTRSDE